MILTNENNILPFYQSVYVQAIYFDIFFIPCRDISTTIGLLDPDLPEATQTVMNTVMGEMFREEGVINKDLPPYTIYSCQLTWSRSSSIIK